MELRGRRLPAVTAAAASAVAAAVGRRQTFPLGYGGRACYLAEQNVVSAI